MEHAIETFKQDGYKIKIYQDEDPMNPRENDNLCVMVCEHRRYELGDRTATETELEAVRRGGFELLERYLRMKEGAVCLVPLGLLDHSGLHMWTGGGSHWSDSAGWDSGTVGFAYITKQRMVELCGTADYKTADFAGTAQQWAEKQIDGEVEEYDQYLRGDVYGYVIEGEDGEHVDSCWGFFGSDYVVKEAKSAAKAQRAHETEQVYKLQQCLAL
jgi:hypothetical protein